MNTPQKPLCGCDRFQRFEGAATQAYIVQFLQKIGQDEEGIHYLCRECGACWKKIEESNRPSLIQVETPEKYSCP